MGRRTPTRDFLLLDRRRAGPKDLPAPPIALCVRTKIKPLQAVRHRAAPRPTRPSIAIDACRRPRQDSPEPVTALSVIDAKLFGCLQDRVCDVARLEVATDEVRLALPAAQEAPGVTGELVGGAGA